MITAPGGDAEELSDLLRAIASGERDAFARLYRRTSAKLFGICLTMLRDRGEAEDVLQDIYTSVWRRARDYDATRASAMTWLITLARNRAIDRLRRHREAPLDDDVARGLIDEQQPSPVANAESSEQRRRLEHCLDELEPKQKSAVRAAFFTGVTYNELAERSGIPLATMKSWIRRSLIRLRSCLER
ncbi:MAG TPA: sigma-70 family RNA polymerase sigma factor [Rhodanobacteraceae bacterium]|nr:sigma-70 family RNA polymerase sigma factor [Rhodanobacteraceae bacterium]